MAKLRELIDAYTDQERMYSWEGARGIWQFEKLIATLGYDAKFGGYLQNFFADNSGAIEAVLDWIGKHDFPEWIEAIESQLNEKEEENENEEGLT